MKNIYSNRKIYRDISRRPDLLSFQISIGETDLYIQTSSIKLNIDLKAKAEKKVKSIRKIIKKYIKKNPCFLTSLEPLQDDIYAHNIIRKMISASRLAEVGPMASVAGCVSEELGKYLLQFCDEVIIENGGDIFIKTSDFFVTGLYAGEESPFSNRLGIKIKSDTPLGICTSSGQLGHSLSFGFADAVTVICENTYIADSFATALGNIVKNEESMNWVLDFASRFPEIIGVVIIVGEKIGAKGKVEFVSIK